RTQRRFWDRGWRDELLLSEGSDEPQQLRPSLSAIDLHFAHRGDERINPLGESSDVVDALSGCKVCESQQQPSVVFKSSSRVVASGEGGEIGVDDFSQPRTTMGKQGGGQ